MPGKIPKHFIDDLISRVDIVELIDARVSLKKTGTNYSACCPFHQEKTPSFTVSPQKQFYYCFGCGAHGNAIGFLINHDKLSFPQAVEQLAGELGMEIPKEAQTSPELSQEHKQLLRIMDVTAQFFAANLRQHPEREHVVDYLKGRGLTGQIAKHFMLGYAPSGWDNLQKHLQGHGFTVDECLKAGVLSANDKGRRYDRFRSRLMFPIRNRKGDVIAFGGRVLDDSKPKYLNSPETPIFHKSETLYGAYEFTQAKVKPARLIVVEGYMDVVALEQSGVYGAVATLGTAITSKHCRMLFRQANQGVVFCFDGDEAGKKAAWRALEVCLPLMQEGRQVQFLFLPQGEDPDSYVRQHGVDDFHKQLDEAMSFTAYFLEHMQQGEEIHSIEGRSRLFAKAKPYLAQLPRNLFGHMLMKQFAELVQLESAEVQTYLEQPQTQPTHAPTIPSQSSAPPPTAGPPEYYDSGFEPNYDQGGYEPNDYGVGDYHSRQYGSGNYDGGHYGSGQSGSRKYGKNKKSFPYNKKRPSQQQRMPPRLSLPQRIISLLLTRPTLAEQIDQHLPKLQNLDSTETDLLRHLLSGMQHESSTGGVLESWRDSEHSGELALLATREWELSDEGLQHELQGSIERLLEQEHERKRTALIAKIGVHGLASLTPEERELISDLIKE